MSWTMGHRLRAPVAGKCMHRVAHLRTGSVVAPSSRGVAMRPTTRDRTGRGSDLRHGRSPVSGSRVACMCGRRTEADKTTTSRSVTRRSRLCSARRRGRSRSWFRYAIHAHSRPERELEQVPEMSPHGSVSSWLPLNERKVAPPKMSEAQKAAMAKRRGLSATSLESLQQARQPGRRLSAE